MDFAVPADHRVKLKVSEKRSCKRTARELRKKLWKIKVTVIPVILVCLARSLRTPIIIIIILRKCAAGYKLSSSQEKINHLMNTDDIELFAKNEKELETLIRAVRIYSQDIGIEFGIEKCAMLVLKSGKRHMTEEWNYDKIRTLEENETYKYLGILEADTIKQVEMKDKIRKEYLRRTRNLLETKLSSRNLIKGINTWAVALVRYSGPFLKWTRDELKQMDQRTRKLITMHKALHPRDDVDRL